MHDYSKTLPIGTIVRLNGATHRLMILGYQRTSADENDDMIYDYCGCPYPEGYISPMKTVIFNHDLIDRIYYLGLQNGEEAELEERLKAFINERESSSDTSGDENA